MYNSEKIQTEPSHLFQGFQISSWLKGKRVKAGVSIGYGKKAGDIPAVTGQESATFPRQFPQTVSFNLMDHITSDRDRQKSHRFHLIDRIRRTLTSTFFRSPFIDFSILLRNVWLGKKDRVLES